MNQVGQLNIGTETIPEDARLPLRPSWTPVGTMGELRRVGDFRSRRLSGVPVIVLRAAEGAAVYRNTCPHQGHPLIGTDAAGHATTLVCPWHAWVFTLAGALRPVQLTGTVAEPPNRGRGPFDLVTLPSMEASGVVWCSTASPNSLPPDLDPPFVSDAPPARLRVATGWIELLDRVNDFGGRPLGTSTWLVPAGRDGRHLLNVSLGAPGPTELISWFDPGSAPMPYGFERLAFLRALAGIERD